MALAKNKDESMTRSVDILLDKKNELVEQINKLKQAVNELDGILADIHNHNKTNR